MAAIHLRETGLDPNYRGNNGGSWQLDPPPAGVDQFDFIEAGCWAAEHLAGKIEEQFGGQGIKPLASTMDPTKKDDEYVLVGPPSILPTIHISVWLPSILFITYAEQSQFQSGLPSNA